MSTKRAPPTRSSTGSRSALVPSIGTATSARASASRPVLGATMGAFLRSLRPHSLWLGRGVPAGVLRQTLRPGQQFAHLIVGGLRKIFVPEPDRPERLRRRGANHLVHHGAKCVARL